MSLDYDLRKIKNLDETCYYLDENGEVIRMKETTNAIIMATMRVDLFGLTEENVEEFYFRLHILRGLYGGSEFMAWRKEEDDTKYYSFKEYDFKYGESVFNITLRDLREHIGLSTNVSNKTRRQWVTRYFLPKKGEKDHILQNFINRIEHEYENKTELRRLCREEYEKHIRETNKEEQK